MDHDILFILCVIFTAYAFEFINGFHDAANSIATIVTTGVLKPGPAVLWAASFNFIAFLFFNMTVAKTIGQDLIDASVISVALIFAGLLSAILWGLLTWYYGIPTSSSQALIGGLGGAALVQGGFAAIKWVGLIKVFMGMFIAPIVGLSAGFILTFILTYVFKKQGGQSINQVFKGFQLMSSAFLSLTHGANDAQKTMGIIAALLFSATWIKGSFYVPFWVVISSYLMIALGTLAGGWRIVQTLGTKITKLNTMRGCCAETGAAMVICAGTEWGIPISTTQTVTGSIVGVGLVEGMAGTCWSTLKVIFSSWLLTVPITGMVAAIIFEIIK